MMEIKVNGTCLMEGNTSDFNLTEVLEVISEKLNIEFSKGK